MIEVLEKGVDKIIETLDAIQQNKPFTALDFPEGCALKKIADKVNSLGANLRELNTFLADLSNGKLDTDIPVRKNYLAAAAKQLHANLNHLTWQTQQIAKGDYNQRVDFIGSFSDSFNELTKQLREREDSLKARTEILQTIFDHVESIFIFNEQNRNDSLYINNFAKRTFNLLSENSNCSFVEQLTQIDINSASEHELYDADSNQWFEVLTTRLRWLNNIPAVLFYCINITSHKKKQSELENKAFSDPLTGLNNRRSLEIHMNRLLEEAIAERFSVTCFMIDIDFFKKFNDTYGHIQGDACLKAVAKCMKNIFIRSTDFVARYGGEEFLATSQNMTPEAAVAFAEKLRFNAEKLRIPLVDRPDETLTLTVSVGVYSIFPRPGATTEQLIAEADAALYKSKRDGRNRVTLAE